MGRAPDVNKPTTIYDVARVAGVSHQTVSRVLRGLQGMSDETRERVQRVAADLHYRPSVVARELASSRPSRIGVVGYETFESSTSKVLKGVNDVATAAGYVLDIVTVDPLGEVDEIARRLDAINGSDAAGLLATSPTANVRQALEHSVFRMPVFLDVNGDVDHTPGPLLRHQHLGSAGDGSSDRTWSPADRPRGRPRRMGQRIEPRSRLPCCTSRTSTSTRRWWCGATGRRSPATRPRSRFPSRPGSPRSSLRTIGWPSACCALWPNAESGCRRTSAWQESMTFLKPHTSVRRSPRCTSTSPRAVGSRLAASSA